MNSRVSRVSTLRVAQGVDGAQRLTWTLCRDVDARRPLHAVGIDLGHIGHEHQAAARVRQHPLILGWGARIVREVLVGPELHRVDENTRDEALAVTAGRIYQAD